MSLVEAIAKIRQRRDLDEDGRRGEIYGLKVAALIKAASIGRDIAHNDYTFRINSARMTPEHSLALDVTFTRPPAAPVTHQITIVNPPVLTRERKEDLKTVIAEMLEGFV